MRYVYAILIALLGSFLLGRFWLTSPPPLPRPQIYEQFRAAWPHYRTGETVEELLANRAAVEEPLARLTSWEAQQRGYPVATTCQQYHFRVRPGNYVYVLYRGHWCAMYVVGADGTPYLSQFSDGVFPDGD